MGRQTADLRYNLLEMENVYVTVGTTRFDALVQEITSEAALKALKQLGCLKLVIQYGKGAAVNVESIKSKFGIDVLQYDFKFESVRTDILNADLIVGHAGAGTCLDVLQHKKPALIVINQALMDNHQTELALQLAEDGHLYQCEVPEIAHKLATLDFQALIPYQSKAQNMQNFVNYLIDFIQ